LRAIGTGIANHRREDCSLRKNGSVPEVTMLAIKTILHPTDFSPQAESAFQVALALARQNGAQVVVLHVRDALQSTAYGEFGAFPLDPGDDRRALEKQLAQIERNHQPVVSEAVMAEGNAATEIVRAAQDRHCDMIVMGTHGRTGLARLLMGSVAEQVLRQAPCPVLTVKNMPAAAAAKTAAEQSAVTVGSGVP
jgi:nucleotide-binding universal stress UspA family protein